MHLEIDESVETVKHGRSLLNLPEEVGKKKKEKNSEKEITSKGFFPLDICFVYERVFLSEREVIMVVTLYQKRTRPAIMISSVSLLSWFITIYYVVTVISNILCGKRNSHTSKLSSLK